jgi:hypothetical protein
MQWRDRPGAHMLLRMPTPRNEASVALTTRFIHGSLIAGVVIFGLIVQFIFRQQTTPQPSLPPIVVTLIPGVSLALCAAALFLRRIVPRRASDESADLFWQRVLAPAMIVWAVLEAAGLIGVIGYWMGDSVPALGAAAASVVVSIFLNPTVLEAR